MDGAEIIRLLVNSNLTWAAALTIMSVVLRPVLMTLSAGLVEARKAAVRAIDDRNANEREQTRVLSGVQDALNDTSTVTRSVLALLQPVSQLPANIEAIGQQMTKRADTRDDMVRSQGQRIEAIQQLIQNLPDAYLAKTAAHFDPTLTNIQASINLLRQQIESRQDAMTPDVAKEIRAELAKIYRLVSAINEKNGTGESPGPSTKEQG